MGATRSRRRYSPDDRLRHRPEPRLSRMGQPRNVRRLSGPQARESLFPGRERQAAGAELQGTGRKRWGVYRARQGLVAPRPRIAGVHGRLPANTGIRDRGRAGQPVDRPRSGAEYVVNVVAMRHAESGHRRQSARPHHDRATGDHGRRFRRAGLYVDRGLRRGRLPGQGANHRFGADVGQWSGDGGAELRRHTVAADRHSEGRPGNLVELGSAGGESQGDGLAVAAALESGADRRVAAAGLREGLIVDIDPKRTGVKASLIPVVFGPEPNATVWYSDKNRLCGPPGAYLDRHPQNTPDEWTLCCPGCGEAGGPREGAKWTATSGSFEDVTTLTLSPSIHCAGCCGWH